MAWLKAREERATYPLRSRALGEYALRLGHPWTAESAAALSEDDLVVALRELIDQDPEAPCARGALMALEGPREAA